MQLTAIQLCGAAGPEDLGVEEGLDLLHGVIREGRNAVGQHGDKLGPVVNLPGKQPAGGAYESEGIQLERTARKWKKHLLFVLGAVSGFKIRLETFEQGGVHAAPRTASILPKCKRSKDGYFL